MEIEKLIGKLDVGQKIILKLQDKIIVGELSFKKIPSHVRVKDCTDYETNEKLGSNNVYYMNEIRDIRVMGSKETRDDEQCQQKIEEIEVKQTKDALQTKLSEERYKNIRATLDSRIFIERYDVKYFDACRDLMKQRQIGVCLEDVRYGRRSKASVLAVATNEKVYVFDLLMLDGIKKELKGVFESSSICKVIHYSKMTQDYLKNRCNIKVRLIFDTMMAYFYISGNREALTVAELISKLFNLPYIEPSKNLSWNLRPIKEEIISQAAFSVGFLIEIQQYLMHKHLLKNFYRDSMAAMQFSCNDNDFPYTVKLVKGKEVIKNLRDPSIEDEAPVDLREIKKNEEKNDTDTSK
ncbi:piRNA biogenesis protein EXD1 [Culicoides brevitarsis]|uniref:piRNA biogenesis protein EXD1 n=1 Tax=Culicoides brevitarsis TaxID=469753 RepID=UPI00307C35B0